MSFLVEDDIILVKYNEILNKINKTLNKISQQACLWWKILKN